MSRRAEYKIRQTLPLFSSLFYSELEKTGACLCKVVIVSPIKISYSRYTSCITYSVQGKIQLSFPLLCCYLCHLALASHKISFLQRQTQGCFNFIKQNFSTIYSCLFGVEEKIHSKSLNLTLFPQQSECLRSAILGAFAATRSMFAFSTFSFHLSSAVGIVKTGSYIAVTIEKKCSGLWPQIQREVRF